MASDGLPVLAAGRDRLCMLLDRLLVFSEREIEFLPHRNHGVSQLSDQPRVMRRGGRNPQSLGASRDRRIVDRLDVDPMLVKQEVARLFAQVGISDHDRHDVRLCRQHRQAGFAQSRLGCCDGCALARTTWSTRRVSCAK